MNDHVHVPHVPHCPSTFPNVTSTTQTPTIPNTMTATALSKPSLSHPPLYLVTILIFAALLLHAVYITHRIRHHLPYPPHHTPTAAHPNLPIHPNLPTLLIYRRTKKSGSSAMLDALLRALEPYRYVPLYASIPTMRTVVRAESVSPNPRRLLVAEHNDLTRADYPARQAVVLDTIRDGYDQITSFCRYLKRVKTCDAAMVACLESASARAQITYRWAGREREDSDTYIDLPLSTAHPALSTTVLRRVFPNVTLDIQNWNSANRKCPEEPMLRKVYTRLYAGLDHQVNTLLERLLMLAGYPCTDDSKLRDRNDDRYHISLKEMLAAAEANERDKYDIELRDKRRTGFSDSHRHLISTVMLWSRQDNNSITLTQRWEKLLKPKPNT